MNQSNIYRKLLVAIGAVLTALALVAPAANAAEPAPGYEQFAGCPSPEENPTIFACARTTVTGGHFQMGNKDVPISNPIVLSGGSDEFGNVFASPKGGMTPVKQVVPGGVIGLTGLDWLVDFLSLEALKLYAVTELAGQPKLNGGPENVSLPIKVHLINPVLGNNCYVGSVTNPIKLNLITGTTNPPPPNEPITGKDPELSFEGEILKFNDGIYVDNAFSAPGANGCKLVLFGFLPISINSLVNSASGLPSPAGTNETVQNFDLELAPPGVVYP